jgi:hypothetical protein
MSDNYIVEGNFELGVLHLKEARDIKTDNFFIFDEGFYQLS